MPELIHSDNTSHSDVDIFPLLKQFSIQESKLRASRSLMHDLGNVMVGLYSFEGILDESIRDQSYQDDVDLFKESLARVQEILQSITELNSEDSSSLAFWDFEEWISQESTFLNAALPSACFLEVKPAAPISVRLNPRLMRAVLMVLLTNIHVPCSSSENFVLTWHRSLDEKDLDVIIDLPLCAKLDSEFFELGEEDACAQAKKSNDSRYFAFFYAREQIRQFGGKLVYEKTNDGVSLRISLPLSVD